MGIAADSRSLPSAGRLRTFDGKSLDRDFLFRLTLQRDAMRGVRYTGVSPDRRGYLRASIVGRKVRQPLCIVFPVLTVEGFTLDLQPMPGVQAAGIDAPAVRIGAWHVHGLDPTD